MRKVMAVRQATSDDAGAIGAVQVAVWLSAYSGLISERALNAQDASIRTSFWKRYLDDSNWPVFVAESGHQVVGFASCIPCRDTDLAGERVCELAAIYLLKQVSHSGVGTSLLSHCNQEGLNRGFNTMTLWVLEQNKIARAFYEKHGFKGDGTRTRDVNLDAFEIRMRSVLPLDMSLND